MEQNQARPMEQLDYPEPHRTEPHTLTQNQLALSDPDLEIVGEWPWPHYPRQAPRNFVRARDGSGRYERLPGHEKEAYVGWEGDFLEAYRLVGIVAAACERADVSTRLIAARKQKDPVFAEAFKEAALQAADRLESEARRRAVYGVKRTKYQLVKDPKTGKMEPMAVEEYTEYSDRLLIELLRANNPQKFAPAHQEAQALAGLEDYVRQNARARGMSKEREDRLVEETKRIYTNAKP